MSRKGLPAEIRMRHDVHYVEELAGQRLKPIGRLILTDQLDPNPEQPRVDFGDLDDLVSSIKEKGVLEPLLVRVINNTDRWMIIAGERRWRAARLIGLREIPCIELDVDDVSLAEIALIENMQRKDLTPWEEADGLSSLCNKYGYTHEDIAKKVGKSRSTVTESLSLASLPEQVREECRRADITSKSTLLQVARQPNIESMLKLISMIVGKSLSREEARVLTRFQRDNSKSKQKLFLARKNNFVYEYELNDKSVRLRLQFKRSKVEKSDIIKSLKLLTGEIERDNKSQVSTDLEPI